MSEQTPEQQIATTILQQLGGRHFLTMTGAKNLHTMTEGLGGLQFAINSTNYQRRKVNRVQVVLDPSDTYIVRALYVRAGKVTVVAEMDDVYCSELQESFERVTGMLPCFPGREVRYGVT